MGAAGLSFGNNSFRGIDTQFEVPRSEKKWSSDHAILTSAFDPGTAPHGNTLTLLFVSQFVISWHPNKVCEHQTSTMQALSPCMYPGDCKNRKKGEEWRKFMCWCVPYFFLS